MGFAQHGSRVGLLGRSQAELDLTKLEIEHAGGTALRIRADVRDFEQVSAAVDRMTVVFGAVNTLVANAAILGPIGPFAQQKPKDWKEVFETNVIGVMNACRAVLPQMLHRRSGKILIIVDDGADRPRPWFAPYAASKAAIVRFAESLAEEVREQNIQVNSFSPGGTYTSMTDDILHADEHAGSKEVDDAEKIRLTGGIPADKQIQLALFLASERSNHLTGKLINVTDDLKKLEHDNARPDAWTLRRHLK
jgi:NAD(P)-dependent dehydrogenase (short-subunit alcohol dehydrogenase family)